MRSKYLILNYNNIIIFFFFMYIIYYIFKKIKLK